METYESLQSRILSIEKTFLSQTEFLPYFKNLIASSGDKHTFNKAPRITDENQKTILIKAALALQDTRELISASNIDIKQKSELRKIIMRDIRCISSVIEPGIYNEENYR